MRRLDALWQCLLLVMVQRSKPVASMLGWVVPRNISLCANHSVSAIDANAYTMLYQIKYSEMLLIYNFSVPKHEEITEIKYICNDVPINWTIGLPCPYTNKSLSHYKSQNMNE